MEYYNKIGLRNLPQVFMNGFPLSSNELEGDSFEEAVVTKIMTITPEIQMAVYRGSLYDSMNLLDWLMNKDDIMPRLNNRILSQEREYISTDLDQEFLNNIKYLSNQEGIIYIRKV
jgi:UDP-glucose:glycoprotein glucosyltransferase